MANRYNMGDMGPAPRQSLFADYNPLLQEKLNKRRSVFSPHQKLRMNIVPMFLNLFVPWGVFVFCLGLTSTYIMYIQPTVVDVLLMLVLFAWIALVLAALWARLYEPDPTWFTHFALAVGVAALLGTRMGKNNFESYGQRYWEIKDLKVAYDVDTGVTPGSSLSDVGIAHFKPGHGLSPTLSWHFKSGSLYCVAPILSNVTLPLNQEYDFWAIGKDCCSTAASDFRCGSWGNVGSKGGIREMSAGEAQKYRLAVQQAESLYNIRAPRPIFFKWSADPQMEVESWNQTVFKNFIFYSVVAFVVSLFSMAMHTCRFAWLGRGESVYSMDFYDDSSWRQGGYQKPMDYGVQTYSTA
mmetsp:Transcript_105720/g.309227  ORF Transcript_105720/g.309227 Transcript_105720/m.309227 type:complete len:353 (+) Transcript_105720:82-1140(+)